MESYAVLDLTKCLVNDQVCTSYRSIKNIALPDATNELNKLSTYKMINPIQTNVATQETLNLKSDDMAIVTPSRSIETKKSNESTTNHETGNTPLTTFGSFYVDNICDPSLNNIGSTQLIGVNITDPKSTTTSPLNYIHSGLGFLNPNYLTIKSKDEIIKSKDEISTHLCTKCQKIFKTKYILARHIKRHEHIKQFICTICNKGYIDSYTLRRHIRVHTCIFPFKCTECDKCFNQRYNLRVHLAMVHQLKDTTPRSKIYVCDLCGAIYKSSDNYIEHLETTHPTSTMLTRRNDKRSFK